MLTSLTTAFTFVALLTAQTLAAKPAFVEASAGHGRLVVDLRTVAARLRASGRFELATERDVLLRGEATAPAGLLEIRSRGRLAFEGTLRAPGARVSLSGSSLRLAPGARLDVADPAGSGGTVSLVASGLASGVIELPASASIDASGAPGLGGRILFAAEIVRSRGALRALGRGRIEVEARRGFDFSSTAETGGGILRLDPSNLRITSGATSGVAEDAPAGSARYAPTGGTGNLSNADLVGFLASNNVIVHTTGAAGPGTGLQSTITSDTTDGDIEVQAPVVWGNGNFLWLLAQDDLIVEAPVQNGGSGEVLGLAGWDGSFGALDAADPTLSSPTYGNGSGDVFILGTGATGGTAFGSRDGLTAVRGRNISVLGSPDTSARGNIFAMIGYRVLSASGNPFDASGQVSVLAKGAVTLQGGVPSTVNSNDIVRFAQIGHGGGLDSSLPPTASQGNFTGDITVFAGTTLSLADGKGFSYAQIGHGGLASSRTRGRVGPAVAGDPSADIAVQATAITLSATADGLNESAYAQIGHGGTTWTNGVQGSLAGKITIGTATKPVTSLTLISDHKDTLGLGEAMGAAQVGHGGYLVSGRMVGSQQGDIEVHVAGDLSISASSGSGHIGAAQIGHGGQVFLDGKMGDATGTVTVTVGGRIDLVGGGLCELSICTSQIGHGGALITAGNTIGRGVLTGDIDVESQGPLALSGGAGQLGSGQIGHGGPILSFFGGSAVQGDPGGSGAGASGSVTVKATAIVLTGGAGQAAAAQIGHGGYFAGCAAAQCDPADTAGGTAVAGKQTGAVSVESTTGKLDLVGGVDPGGQALAMIGNGGVNGGGAKGTQGDASGAVSVVVHTETSLVDDPGAASAWWIGHRTTGSITAAPVLLDTGTLDFTTAATSANATIDNAQFWPRLVGGNVIGGDVRLRARGPSGANGDLISREPLTINATNGVHVQASRNLTLDTGGSVTNSGAGFVDFVADDANPSSPNFSPTALLTLNSTVGISGPVRFFAVRKGQFLRGTYVPASEAAGIWYETLGSPVLGANYKLAEADLSVTKGAAPTAVAAGANLTYTITVMNSGPMAAASVSLTDTLPAGTTFVSLATPGGWSCTTPAAGAGGTVTCSIASLAPGQAVFTLVVKVASSVAPGTVISNTATASSTTQDSNPGNESGTAAATVESPPAGASLSAAKVASGSFAPSGQVTYTITLHNSGPAAQGDNPGNELTDVLPAALTLVSASATSGTALATIATNTVTWNGSIAAGGTVRVTIHATLGAAVAPGTVVSNQASLAFDGDGNGTNESAGVSDDPGTVAANDPTSFVVAAAPPAAIPSLSGIGLLALATLLAVSGAYRIRGRGADRQAGGRAA